MKKALVICNLLIVAALCTYGQSFNPTSSINAASSVNTFTGGYTFAYATSGSPWNGTLMSFGGLLNRYDCQISTDYTAGNHISFRTHNGDVANVWNPWYEIYHSGNLNNINADFTARNITANGMHIATGTYSAAQGTYLGWNMSHANGEVNFVNNIGGGTGGFTFDDTQNGTTFTPLVTILGNGNVGIGTTTPWTYKLAVDGGIHSQSVNVDMTGWPDYVFDKDYELPSLSQVENYIDQNHHLPEMPSATEVEQNGLNLGETNKLLTKKVEELTLYLLEQQKIIQSLQVQINDFKKQYWLTSQNKKVANQDRSY